jgi:uncharacterized membrane-anchored protein YhcB (DUF1043 family)
VGVAEDPNRREEIQSSLNSIVETSERWLGRLRTRQFRVRLATSFLTAVTSLLLTLIIGVVALVIRAGNINILPVDVRYLVALGVIGLVVMLSVGFLTYFLMKRKHEVQLKEISYLLNQMKQRLGQTSSSGPGIAVEALSLADKILNLLPEVVRKRSQDSLLFGFLAFVVASIIAHNPGIGILVGAIVWIYFRYETNKTYDQEIAKLEEQKRIFEQRKQEFMESL